MKKYWVILISLILLAPCVWAQTFKRTTKTPGFFVPKGALQTGNKPEKLIPVEAMRYQGQQAPIVVEMQRRAQEKAQKEAEEKLRLQQEEQIHKELSELQTDPEKTEITENNAVLAQETKTEADEKEVITKEEETIATINYSSPPSAEQAARLKAEKIAKRQEQETDDAVFEQIIAEYKRDTKAISESNPIKNQRLIDMIADFKDVEHVI